ncbi:putative TFIIIC transcription initiation factor complex subunits Tfc3 [Aspergillus clavatus NRRL 1]|uniref:Uncharacterized protein n=1 Tax=Aspergillus clavatus (strain ATCC 1007 / CBS 513.65 / DSM 816 / NCTC 3887 / NRRL 1 / QM 1276 / 107) TaxID=344612 RepID=A1C7X7_ASPCL|nr:uncharacterized protein ACLA_075370 [Aspergillus clavatus NRRL 1]EAW14498.1 conserved hypothetical protein [Aspergillus clavatus NRRL 1]
MAPSLQDLIDHLLAEIALCGDQGASPADILTFIDAFYAKGTQESTIRSQTVDRQFQEKVWSWLTRHPEVSVGKEREQNHLSLNDAENLVREADAEHPIRVFVSRERTWLAITGHEPDETKVLPMEFALLSIIASHKANGIVQTDLVKLSGQDKRSVPKRTEMLQQKGYIEKRAIQIKAARTSLCTLRKFSKPDTSTADTGSARRLESRLQEERVIDYKDFTDRLFAILREYRIISRNDLKNLLGFADLWRWKILSRALRKFERIGVLKRVRAASQYADTFRKLHPCVMLIREPTERDFDLFHEYSQNINADLEQEDGIELDEGEDNAATSTAADNKPVSMVRQEEDVEEVGRMIPVWSPDRNIHNQIFEVVDQAGISGVTNQHILRVAFGSFFRRPLENTLTRLVECWQLSQPLHLRHLAIVRDTALERTITHYVHYSTANFQKLVDAGEASWEAVEFVPKNSKADALKIPPVDAIPELDEYGLPVAVPTKELLHKGNASLLASIVAVNPSDYSCTGNDPVAVRLKDGTYVIRYGVPSTPQIPLPEVRQLGRPKGTPNRLKPKTEDLSETEAEIVVTDASVIRRMRKAQRDAERFRGMSEKEKLKAMGLDETWTEYSVLLIERTEPGVYITPRGRRRPAGKRQGRPRISRLAVFKSPKLVSLPWFVEEPEAERADEAIFTSQPVSRAQSIDQTPMTSFTAINGSARKSIPPDTTPSKGRKRRVPSLTSFEANAEQNHDRPSKQRRLNEADVSEDVMTDALASETPSITDRPTDVADKASFQTKRKRQMSPDPTSIDLDVQEAGIGLPRPSPQADENVRHMPPRNDMSFKTPSKKPRVQRNQRLQGPAVASSPPPAVTVENISMLPPPPPDLAEAENREDHRIATEITDAQVGDTVQDSGAAAEEGPAVPAGTEVKDEIPAADAVDSRPVDGPQNISKQSEASQTPDQQGIRTKRSKEKGGSVAVLRRSIVMDIVEKAGGAYPMGTEIWYPFATAWRKTKYKEKPDMRTVKASIKHLVDGGKLRQFTFSGRDSKGIMVTKSIIAKPELRADDPFIKDLQHKMLTTEDRYYFPPNVERDPILTKGSLKSVPKREATKPGQVPIEHGVTVHLHQKPAFVLAHEQKTGRLIQRRLLQRLQDTEIPRPSGVVRLAKLQRREAPGSLARNLTSIARPTRKRVLKPRTAADTLTGEAPPDDVTRRKRRRWVPISLMAPYAMFMNPVQTFNRRTGTFSTDAGLAALQAAAIARIRAAFRLPKSLDDLLDQTRRRPMDYSGTLDPRTCRFFWDTNVILRWELQNEEFIQGKLADEGVSDLCYINQTIEDFPEEVPIEGDIDFEIDQSAFPVVRQRRIRRLRQELPRSLSPEGQVAALEEPEMSEELSESEISSDSEDSDDSLEALDLLFSSDLRRRRNDFVPQSRRLEKLNVSMTTKNDDAYAAAQAKISARQPLRRNRVGQNLPRLVQEKIMTAIVVVRTLAGGHEGKNVDWVLVSNSFPDQDPKVIAERGKNVLSRNRLQVAKMQSDFQERFIEAYATGQVPPIDYDDLEGYDWEAVVDWAHTQLDIPKSEKLPDLPATREQFDTVFELREEPPATLGELYETAHGVTVNRKRALCAGVPFAIPLPEKPAQLTPRQTELARLEVAKTWVRANIVAPEETYRPVEARQALANFGGRLVDDALQSLTTERIVSQGNRGRITPGRNYDITEFFLHTLGRRRNIEVTQLRRATRFKMKTLDPALRSTGSFAINYHAEDGDILALINLAAERRIVLKPQDPPRDKFGLTDGGYLTRQIDKMKLWFVVKAHPVDGSYAYGNPLREKIASTPPPCPPQYTTAAAADGQAAPAKIPLWYDIHGTFVEVLWELAVAAVVGIVAVRPGISADGVASMVQPSMGAWEVLLLLKWMADVGVVRGDLIEEEEDVRRTGWHVQEWWWMVLA